MNVKSDEACAWIEALLPILRCPATHQPLHWADAADLARHGRHSGDLALVTADGAHLYPVDAGIPILLPPASTQSTPSSPGPPRP